LYFTSKVNERLRNANRDAHDIEFNRSRDTHGWVTLLHHSWSSELNNVEWGIQKRLDGEGPPYIMSHELGKTQVEPASSGAFF